MSEEVTGLYSSDSIYQLRLQMTKIDMEDGNPEVVHPIILANPNAVTVKNVREIVLDSKKGSKLNAGSEINLLSFCRILVQPGKLLDKITANIFVPSWVQSTPDKFYGIYGDDLILVEAYDEYNNVYTGMNLREAYNAMIANGKDRGYYADLSEF